MLAIGFYWDEYSDAWGLAGSDERRVRELAIEAARRLGVPFIAVDVGQLDDGEWIVVEVNDAQFAGLSHVPPPKLWSRLQDAVLRGGDGSRLRSTAG